MIKCSLKWLPVSCADAVGRTILPLTSDQLSGTQSGPCVSCVSADLLPVRPDVAVLPDDCVCRTGRPSSCPWTSMDLNQYGVVWLVGGRGSLPSTGQSTSGLLSLLSLTTLNVSLHRPASLFPQKNFYISHFFRKSIFSKVFMNST